MTSVLAGVRVLDFSRVFAGPLCGMLLADMGADVIRVDSPRGEIDRTYALRGPDGETLTYKAINRGKKGITLRLNSEEGVSILEELVRHSDVIIHNFVASTALAEKLNYDKLKKINPGIVVAAITGYGQYGPYAERVCLDYVTQAKSGIMALTGFPDNPPTRTSVAFVDFGTGLSAALGILLALYHREKTGIGQAVDTALFDIASFLSQAVGALMASEVYGRDVSERIYKRGGNFGWSSYMNCLEAKDGWVMITPTSDGLWQRFVKVIGGEELTDDPRFETDQARGENAVIIDGIVKRWVAQRTVDEVVNTLQGAGVPCEPVNTMYQLLDDPQVKAREMIVYTDHPELGRIPLPGNPIKLSMTSVSIGAHAPKLGENNEEIYSKLLGFNQEKLAQLKQRGII
jgi:crotonobetainyl-CoA:carnitine CoA-transferase CaiB-like acyl-CoA transferase